ncbi:hypothetical protein Tco_1037638 [Tanacetum coccineum]
MKDEREWKGKVLTIGRIAWNDDDDDDVINVPGRIAWNDDDDVIDVLGLDSRETPTASHGLPAARLATSKPPAARLAGADVFLNFVFDVTFDPLGVRTSSLHRWEAYEV